MQATAKDGRASNGIFYRVVGAGEPLLLLHGIMVSGDMFDPLVALLSDRFRVLIPDLRGHGRSGALPGPYDVATLAADLDTVRSEAGFKRCAVMGYSHGGAVAQRVARDRPDGVTKLYLCCTYARNASTLRERIEGEVAGALLMLFTPGALAKIVFRTSKRGRMGLAPQQTDQLRALMATNRARPMRGAMRGLVDFDSRPWLGEIAAPTLVIAGAQDHAVPRHHFDALLQGIPNAEGTLIDGADHTLIWTHTRQLAELIGA
jgi:pimeloyl-ACP methyl ester carboxylesterase